MPASEGFFLNKKKIRVDVFTGRAQKTKEIHNQPNLKYETLRL